MSDNKLILYPTNPFASLNDGYGFLHYLETIGFIGENFLWFGETHYKPGAKFYDFIQFFEDWTAIILESTGQRLEEVRREPNRLHCHIELSQTLEEPEIIASSHSLAPKCPFCGDEANWDLVTEWYDNKAHFRWNCPTCKKESHIHNLDWSQATGFARYSIDIWHIHFNEAVPTESLLTALHQFTAETWTWLYYRI